MKAVIRLVCCRYEFIVMASLAWCQSLRISIVTKNGRQEQASLAFNERVRNVKYNERREQASLALKQVLGLRPAELALRLVAPAASIFSVAIVLWRISSEDLYPPLNNSLHSDYYFNKLVAESCA